MERIVIIGGGASGLVTAIYAKRKNNQVIILEKNNKCGKKLLLTGNGRCNFWNQDQSLENYNSTNKNNLRDIITEKNQKEILSFFDKIGIVPKVKDGYYYPNSNQASSISNALLLQVESLGIKIKYNSEVEKIDKLDNKFIITTLTGELISCDKVVLATGSKACPKTGSDGKGYELAKNFNHTIIDVVPSLVQLRGNGSYFKLWNGVRCDARISLFENNYKIKEEYGELQLTDYGISGIPTFNISGLVARGIKNNKKEIVKIDFLPFINKNEQEFITYCDNKNKFILNLKIYQFLEGMLNYKLVETILKVAKIDKQKRWQDLTISEKKRLYYNLKSFEFLITGTNSFDKAQVCSGGVSLLEINPKTMESKLIKNLYIVGELLDVDGICGGYNLSFAWISGMLAGKEISKND